LPSLGDAGIACRATVQPAFCAANIAGNIPFIKGGKRCGGPLKVLRLLQLLGHILGG